MIRNNSSLFANILERSETFKLVWKHLIVCWKKYSRKVSKKMLLNTSQCSEWLKDFQICLENILECSETFQIYLENISDFFWNIRIFPNIVFVWNHFSPKTFGTLLGNISECFESFLIYLGASQNVLKLKWWWNENCEFHITPA